ncbi:MAG: S-layer homology domain-containing protein [Atribacterota bacterium]|nr:S-layer homology domain-containing protein [Atribacterota bacterium]MDD5637860.1 S-layer homology domain-containing protein [Atribacterota bacterium]
MKKLALALVLVFALAIPALANPFVDVPLNHWAYDAVQTLAAKGVVIGYPDGTFGGQRMLTRYEFAEAIARVLAYVEQYGGLAEDVEILSKLAVEFADELARLGVTVADLEATLGEHSEAIAAMKELVDKHERFFEPVKITGTWKADYSKDVFDLSGDPLAPATLTDRVDLKFAAEINPETTAEIQLRIDNVLNGPVTITPRKYNLKYAGDWSLWISTDIEPDDIALGLLYDFDELEEFPGVWAQWEWDTDEDLGTWTAFMDVEDFYFLNVSFNVGDDDDVPIGVTAGYDNLAGLLFGGADIAFDLTDEDDDDQVGLAVEGAVASDLTNVYFGAAAKATATLGEDDDIDLTVTGWYTQPGFDLTNSKYNPDEIGVTVALGFMLTDEEDDLQIKVTPKWDYRMDAAFATLKRNRIGLQLDFTNIDEDNPDEEGYIFGQYRLESGDIYLEGQYLNLDLGDEDEFMLNAYGDYLFSAVPDFTAMANLTYTFPDDPMQFIVEGRLDADGAALYSAEAQLKYDVAENTVLKVGVEMNDWDADIADWSDDDEWIIKSDTTKVYAGVEVKF